MLLEHSQVIGEGWNSIPAELHVVVQTAPNDVKMRVVEAGNNTAAIEIDYIGIRSWFILLVHANNPAILNSEAGGFGMFRIERGDLSILKDQVGRSFRIHVDVFRWSE